MRRTLVAVLLFTAVPLAAVETVATHCSTETISLKSAQTFEVRRILTCADDQPDNTLWYLDRLDSIDGSLDGHYLRTPASALVYVLDSGVEINHNEFADGNVIAGIDVIKELGFASRCGSPNEALHPCFDLNSQITLIANAHGTGVASIIGGRHVGVAPGVKMISVNALSAYAVDWLVVFNDVIRTAWDPATPNVRTAIINMSAQLSGNPIAGDVPYSQMEQKIRDMVGGVDRNGNPDPNGKRFLFVVAGGNTAAGSGGGTGDCDANNQVHIFPATLGPSIAGLITVGGIGRDNHIWSGTCRGPALELLAPAENVMPAMNSGPGDYRLTLSSGTSYSAPIVSGAAAQLLAREPNLTPAEVEERLEATPSFIVEPPDGAAGGKVVYVLYPPEPKRRAVGVR
jgi:subtilisin family serine protease